MDEAKRQHIVVLAEEYVELVEAMRAGQYDGEDAYQWVSSQRGLVHDAPIALTGLTDRPAMYGYCRDLLAASLPN